MKKKIYKLEPIICELITGRYSYMIYNFDSIGNENRIEIDFLLIAPILEGNYNVYVASFDTLTDSIVDLNSVLLPISSTCNILIFKS